VAAKNIPRIVIEEFMEYLLDNWCLLPTPWGDFRMYDTGNEGVRVVCFGDICQQGEKPLLRMHSSCLASEVFASTDCDCADQLRESMQRIAQEARGIIVHLHQEGRGHGLSKKIQAVHLMQFDRLDTVQAFDHLELKQDIRTYEAVVELLRLLKITSVRLISNNPNKIIYLKKNDIEVESVNSKRSRPLLGIPAIL
jgi:GTP cyclohydrolase II